MDIIGRTIAKKYRIIEKTAEGGMSFLFRAIDTTDGKLAAVKILKSEIVSNRMEDLIRFRAGIQKVTGLRHRHIVRVYEAGEVFGLGFIAMEYHEGRSLREMLNRERPTITDCIGLMIGICAGLEYAHRAGIMHRDIRASNILLAGDRALITDFGLSHLRDFAQANAPGRALEFFGPIAPEQTGMTGQNPDERSDLYSLGVVFYQMLTGQPPFFGTDAFTIIHQHITRPPERPGKISADIPPRLDEMVLRLLEKNPDDRYQSAAGLRLDLERLRRGERTFILGLDDVRPRPRFNARFIGRENGLAVLQERFRKAMSGNGCRCRVTGTAGLGKTRLVEEFRALVYEQGVMFIGGKCFAGGNAVPFGPFTDLLDAYLRHIRSYAAPKREAISRRLKDEFRSISDVVVKLNPRMVELLGNFPSAASFGPEAGNKRFFTAAARFFLRLAEIEGVLVIHIDDIQWIDDDSRSLLTYIRAGINGAPLLLIECNRDEDAPSITANDGFLMTKEQLSEDEGKITLAPFTPVEMERFVAELLMDSEERTAGIARVLFDQSRGNPFFSLELLRRIIEERVVTRTGDVWSIDPDAASALEREPTLIDLLIRRIRSLDAQQRRLLSCAAVIGMRFDLEILVRLAGMDYQTAIAIIDHAIALQLLKPDPSVRRRFIFVHDRIRDALYDRMDPMERRQLHRNCGLAIEAVSHMDPDAVIFDLAYHFAEGGPPDKAIAYAYPAGLRARAMHANEQALKYLRKAIELLGGSERPPLDQQLDVWLGCLEGIGDIALVNACGEDSVSLYRTVLSHRDQPFERAVLYRKIAEAFSKKGDFGSCEAACVTGLGLLGERLPIKPSRVRISLAIEFLRHVLGVWPKFSVPVKPERERRYRLILRFYFSLGWPYYLTDPLKFARVILRIVNIAQGKIRRPKEIGMGLAAYASLCGSVSFYGLAFRYHLKALAIRKRIDDEWGVGQSLQLMGYCLLWKGAYARSGRYFRKSRRIFESLGDVYEHLTSLLGEGIDRSLMSDYTGALALYRQAQALAVRAGNRYSLCTAYQIATIAYIESGRLDEAERSALALFNSARERGFASAYRLSLVYLGLLYYERGDYEESVRYLEASGGGNGSRTFGLDFARCGLYHLAEAYSARFLSRQTETAGIDNRRELKKIRAACAAAVRECRRWRLFYSGALRAMAKYHALAGNYRRAEKYFRDSIAMAVASGRRFEEARCRYDYALCMAQTGNSEQVKALLEQAYFIFDMIGAKLYVRRIRAILGMPNEEVAMPSMLRFVRSRQEAKAALLAREMQAITEPDELMNAALLGAIELSTAGIGAVYLAGDGQIMEQRAAYAAGGDDFPNDAIHALARQVRATRAWHIVPVSNNGYRGGREWSLIGVPLLGGHEPLGVCCLGIAGPGRRFSERDAAILMIFFSSVAVLLENALLQERLEELRRQERETVPSVAPEVLAELIGHIDANYAEDLGREKLAARTGLHPDQLGRLFRLHTGKKISAYISECRVRAAAVRLDQTDDEIIEIAYGVGFESLTTFNRAFLTVMNMTPSEYRKRDRAKRREGDD